MSKTLFQKIWESHEVTSVGEGVSLLYIDRHLVHEVTSPQAFEGLRLSGRKVRRPELTFSTMDHNVPTTADRHTIRAPVAKVQMDALTKNCSDFGIALYGIGSDHQGIVHVIGPELGITVPGLTVVCGDSHTSTHGAFGCLAFGIGTSEVEHVMATQTLRQTKPKTFEVEFFGQLAPGATAKDMILKLIGTIGTAGATGYVIEYTGEAVRALTMAGRMTICNMTIEGGARAGMISPDDTTYDFIGREPRPFSPKAKDLEAAVTRWKELPTDQGAVFDKSLSIDASTIAPQITWGTNPGMVVDVTGRIPGVDAVPGMSPQDVESALDYMGLRSGTAIEDIPVDTVFFGSCTNSRMEDLRLAAGILKGRKISNSIRLIVVPGSQKVRREAESEGLDKVFVEAGAEWRFSGCSMCLGMNPDQLKPKERCASTSNRNFEGRQGKGGRTHLVSPEMAAVTALEGHFVDIREWLKENDVATL